MNNKDILRLIALEICDYHTWYAFSLVCKSTAHVVRLITEQRSKNPEFFEKKHTEFFQMPVYYSPPKQPSINMSINMSNDIFIGDSIMIGRPQVQDSIFTLETLQFSMICGKKSECNHNNCYVF